MSGKSEAELGTLGLDWTMMIHSLLLASLVVVLQVLAAWLS